MTVIAGNVAVLVIVLTNRLVPPEHVSVEAARRIRDHNEARALHWAEDTKAGKQIKPGASIVRAADLTRAYLDGAGAAYDGQTITVPLKSYEVRGREVHWHLGDKKLPAAVVMQLAEGAGVPANQQAHRTLWVTGRCAGMTKDGGQREVAGYDFHVRVEGCWTNLE